MKITCIIPTVRNVDLNLKCLERQTFTDFETIVTRPEGKKPDGLFYTLCRDYNRAFRQVKGELIISYQDGIEIRPDALERFWNHYLDNPKACVGAVGDQYTSLNPPVKVWTDPRRNDQYGSFYEIYPIDIEFTFCSLPKRAIFDVGGMDEEYDFGAAVGEKEMMLRIDRAGYKTYIDQSIEYKALKHDRLTKDWDHYYKIASDLFSKHSQELERGKRNIHLDNL